MKRLFIAIVSLGLLGGCAVVPYDAPYYGYGGSSYYDGAAPYYYGAAPYYGGPAYVGPPVSLSLDFGWISGGGRGFRHGGRGFGHRR